MVFSFIKRAAPLLLFFLLLTGCKTDWSENFSEKKKSPFGTYILHNEVSELFDDREVTSLKKNIHDYLNTEGIDSINTKNYILIKKGAYNLTDKGTDKLLNFVAKGNHVFLGLHYFKDTLKASLGFGVKQIYPKEELKYLKGTLALNNKEFEKTTYNFNRNIRKNYFLSYNKNTTTVLGTVKVKDSLFPNFIKINYGKGAFLLHSNPIAFTNYYLLNKKESYTANVFSYLPNKPILWDLHIKKSKFGKPPKDNRSVFKFFLAHKPLKWFLFVTLTGIILFMLFNAKRKQNPIPIKVAEKNTTVAFAQTIANLYLEEEDHKNLVDKRISFFLEKIRSNYLLDTSNLNALFIEKLAAKSGNDIQRTKYLIHSIISLKNRTECSEEELIVLYKMTKNFLNKKYGDTK